MGFHNYRLDGFWDEMFAGPGQPRSITSTLFQILDNLPGEEIAARQQAAERAFLHLGITFNVYGDSAGTEKIRSSVEDDCICSPLSVSAISIASCGPA